MGPLFDQNNKKIALGKQLGRGGEGSVYEVNGEPQKVAKIFIPEKRAYYEPRLAVMIPNPPEDPTKNINHISICWPERMLFENRQFVGYIMPRIQSAPDIFKVYSPRLREKELPNFNWRYLVHTAFNLACSVNAYHKASYVIGDLNSKNVKVNQQALVTMIDADSIQIPATGGRPVMRCPVGTPDFTSPELQGIKLDTVDRSVHHDAFALAVMIFLLLMEGQHPFTGAPVNPSFSVPGPVYQYCIKNGIFPYQINQYYKPPAGAPNFSNLDPTLQALFLRCFVDGHKNNTLRPLPFEWAKTLQVAENNLVQCKASKEHWYSKHLSQCPWCTRSGQIAARRRSIPKPVQPPPVRPPVQSQPRPVKKPTPPPPVKPPPPARRGNSKVWVTAFLVGGLLTAALIVGGITALGLFSPVGSGTLPGGKRYPTSAQTDTTRAEKQSDNTVDMDNLPPRSSYCVGAPTLILKEGDRAKVITSSSLRGRLTPEITEANISARYEYGDILEIIYGPVCVKSSSGAAYWFWMVSDLGGKEAWVAEGDMKSYFLRLVK